MSSSATRTEIETELYAYLSLRFPQFARFDARTLLLDGAVDSLGMLELMTFLGDRFGFVLEDSDFEPENFETPGHIVQFVERKQSR